MKAADAIVKCLQKENVEVVFGYPGGAVLPLYDALRNNGMVRHILVRHEQAAVHSASGYARTTGSVGVAIGTSGPGATNLITGIATAYMDSIPLVIITGQVRTDLMGRDVFQEVDITGATEPFIKHSYLVRNAQQLPRIMKEAFHIASTGRPGPVLIDIPVDIQNTRIEFNQPDELQIRGYKPTFEGHVGQIKRALRKLRHSKKPLICVGGGILHAKATKELAGFALKARIPVVHTLMGIGAMGVDHPYYFGMIGSHGFAHANRGVGQADLLVVIGARVADRATAGSGIFAKNAEIIHIDIDPAEIGKNLGTLIPVVGDAKHILQQLSDGIEPLETEEWVAELASIRDRVHTEIHNKPGFVNPKQVLRDLGEVVDDQAVVTADVGQNQLWAARNFPMQGDRKLLMSGGLGTMGYSLPAAVGAKVAAPDRQVVAIVGDGGFQMSMFELGTIAQNRLAIVILLFNNSRLGMVRELQDRGYGETFGIDITDGNPDFIALVQAYGFQGVQVTNTKDFSASMRVALESGKPYLVECIVDAKESTL